MIFVFMSRIFVEVEELCIRVFSNVYMIFVFMSRIFVEVEEFCIRGFSNFFLRKKIN